MKKMTNDVVKGFSKPLPVAARLFFSVQPLPDSCRQIFCIGNNIDPVNKTGFIIQELKHFFLFGFRRERQVLLYPFSGECNIVKPAMAAWIKESSYFRVWLVKCAGSADNGGNFRG